MPITAMPTPPILAPRRLVTETRAELREAALRRLDALPEGETALTIDLAPVVDVDIGGIGMLVFLQKRAEDRGLATRLLNVPTPVERLLALTELDDLFEIQG